jgi:hypothetical protein
MNSSYQLQFFHQLVERIGLCINDTMLFCNEAYQHRKLQVTQVMDLVNERFVRHQANKSGFSITHCFRNKKARNPAREDRDDGVVCRGAQDGLLASELGPGILSFISCLGTLGQRYQQHFNHNQHLQ